MKVTLTAGKLMDIGAWDEVCNLKDWSVWCVNEGQMDSDEEVHFSDEDLKKCPTVRGYLRRRMDGD